MKFRNRSLAITSTLSAMTLALLPHAAQAGINDILITEYVQNNNEVSLGSIEITNTHAAESFTFTDATQAVILGSGSYVNVLTNADGSLLLSGITLAAGQSLVLLNSGASAEYQTQLTTQGAIAKIGVGTGNYDNVYVNGNDSFYLQHNGSIIDIVGPNSADGYWGNDLTLRRRLAQADELPSQSATYNSNQWLSISPATISGMGDPTLAAAATETPQACNPTHRIGDIQGTAERSPLEGESVTVQGIVSAIGDIPSDGFFLQDLSPDNDPLSSDGIFVYSRNASAEMVGQTVCVSSVVSEYYGQTQLSAGDWVVTNSSISPIVATDIQIMAEDNGLFERTLERYEGMLVRLPHDLDANLDGEQTMRVSKTFGFNYNSYRNDLILAYQRPNLQPNQRHIAASPEAQAALAQNNDYRLIVESNSTASNGNIPYYPNFNADPANNYIRIDDSVVGMEGLISYGYGDYTLTVSNTLDNSHFIHNRPRTDAPQLSTEAPADHFAITVASFNLFNYFNSPFGGDQNNFGQNRGADDVLEYERQKAKLVAAIRALDADVLGLMEMENNGFGLDSAIAELVNEINTYYNDEYADNADKPYSTENRYVFVGYDHNNNQLLDNADAIGSDAIATGLIYRPSKVSLVSTQVIPMPQQKAPSIVNDFNEVIKDNNDEILESGQNYNRDALLATFYVNQTGKRLTVAVNHLKSKGSTCWEEWQGVEFGAATQWNDDPIDLDGQGSCEHLRVSAAVQLGEELADIPGDRIILGDLNAYAQEDPLLVLTENPRNKTINSASYSYIGHQPQFNIDGAPALITHSYGYLNALAIKGQEKGVEPWSYAYNDEVGSLDYILLSPSMEQRLIDAVDWHINAPESSLFDYNSEYKPSNYLNNFYQVDPVRASDHDPAIIALAYQAGEHDDTIAVRLPLKDKLMKVPYHIPSGIGSQAGDIAHVSLQQADDNVRLDLSQLVPSSVVLTQDHSALLELEVFGAPAAFYYAKMHLTRDGVLVEGSQTQLYIEVRNRDDLVASLVKAPKDNSGGTASVLAILGLFFSTLWRRIQSLVI